MRIPRADEMGANGAAAEVDHLKAAPMWLQPGTEHKTFRSLFGIDAALRATEGWRAPLKQVGSCIRLPAIRRGHDHAAAKNR